jgi:hypothetical protein
MLALNDAEVCNEQLNVGDMDLMLVRVFWM